MVRLMKNKLVVYNPHFSLFGTNLLSIITGKPPVDDKISFIKEILTESKIFVYLDEYYNHSSISLLNKIPFKFIRKIINIIEFYFWTRYYNIKFSRVKILKKIEFISEDDLILFCVHKIHKNNKLKNSNAKKLVYASHYFYDAKNRANILSKINNITYISESNLSIKSNFFKSLYGDKTETYIIPFQVKDRFKNYLDWYARSNKCLALGTTHKLDYNKQTKDFIDYFKNYSWHFMREELYKNKNYLNEIMNIKIERFDEGLKTSSNRYISYIQNLFFVGKQNKYMSFDIVKTFNNHKMFIAPEERAFLPSINFVEGIACGCAYIGLHSDIYKDIGLQPGIHYIDYDGSLKDLKYKIRYYQDNDDELRLISRNGYNFIKSIASKEIVKKLFLKDVEFYFKNNTLKSSFQDS
tara:strand:- start:18954 stop:20183 length:1230 start_codon:yes stop_codon:yes gene_type:complete